MGGNGMIREVTMYEVVCDGCGRKYERQYLSAETVRLVAMISGSWKEIGNKNYCPDCYEYDEETNEYKPKSK